MASRDALNVSRKFPFDTMILSTAQSESIRLRIRDLGVLESSLAHRSRLTSSFTRLRFKKPPTSYKDDPADLDDRYAGSAEFIAYRSWLRAKQKTLEATERLGDKDADHRLEAMLQRFEEEHIRLDHLQHLAWQKEMVERGLLRVNTMGPPAPVQAPEGELHQVISAS